ncbi:sodium:solute symporter [Chitinophaga sp. GCM10012297]|uniref:Sodium:solute symporter n=1 Tax=Chitinophaga chungangae TaxID=2821488 RepID=A0ABS3Y7U5_9BACT|nr:sodium:solute symporter [Chitinophaga chungangae]MBO9150701.1 sodium:solute symporter [Chitinophaga chungangae]
MAPDQNQFMSPGIFIVFIASYFFLLLLISYLTTRKADAQSYFIGNKNSVWYLVAIGMISDSLSGVTFISVPGKVEVSSFSYLQTILGYILGYVIIAAVLLPLYYNRNLTSIYTYLQQRFGPITQKTGAVFFILSRLVGAAARLFLVAGVLQLFVFDYYNVPFALSVSIMIALMLVYTYRGGIKTLVWTDAMQSTFLLLAVVLTIVVICSDLNWNVGDLISNVASNPRSKTFFWDWKASNFFPKEFFGGMMIAVTMTGLDQNMMQKNLSCRSLGEAQKNIYSFSIMQLVVNVFFLSLGVLLYEYMSANALQVPLGADGRKLTDQVFPLLALTQLGTFASIIFIVGLTAATFSSADSVLTTLTTSFYIDILGQPTEGMDTQKKRLRNIIHVCCAIALLLTILLFKAFNESAVIDTVLFLATITYGPMLGLFAFGILNKRPIVDYGSVIVCVISPVLCFILSKYSTEWLGGYKFGNELLIVNGLFTYIGLWLFSKNKAALQPLQ